MENLAQKKSSHIQHESKDNSEKSSLIVDNPLVSSHDDSDEHQLA